MRGATSGRVLAAVAAAALGGAALAARPPEGGAAKPPAAKAPAGPSQILVAFHHGSKELPEATMRFGILLPKMPEPRLPTRMKQLTFAPLLWTNNTCVKLDGDEFLFGSAPGRWDPREARLGRGRDGLRSAWLYPDKKVLVTQTVEVVKGLQTGNVDTCLVRYDVENKDDREHTVGVRFLLDTFVGTNDGAPFLLPGERALCETRKDYQGADRVPPFAQALERMDFKAPGVVAHLDLRPGGLERPDRVVFGGWPNPQLGLPAAQGFMTKWNVPAISMRQTIGTKQLLDSAATLYWAEKKLPAGGRRAVGFRYGLGNFSADEGGELGLVLAGPFRAGGEMTVLALVKGPQGGQTATLKLPKGLEVVGEATRKVPLPPATSESNVSPVTWTVRTPAADVYAFTVELSTGASLRQGVRINPAK